MNGALGTLIKGVNVYVTNIFIYVTEQQSPASN